MANEKKIVKLKTDSLYGEFRGGYVYCYGGRRGGGKVYHLRELLNKKLYDLGRLEAEKEVYTYIHPRPGQVKLIECRIQELRDDISAIRKYLDGLR